jgi:hypothetical protein
MAAKSSMPPPLEIAPSKTLGDIPVGINVVRSPSTAPRDVGECTLTNGEPLLRIGDSLLQPKRTETRVQQAIDLAHYQADLALLLYFRHEPCPLV